MRMRRAVVATHMNFLTIGRTPKQFSYEPGALYIDDHPPKKKGVHIFDPAEHGLNLLPVTNPRDARAFADILFPDKDLMTYRNGRRALTRLVMKYPRIDKIKFGRSDEDKEAKGVIDDLLISPLLKKCLTSPIPRWLFSGVPVAVRLDRKQIGDDDARVIACLLMLRFTGQIIAPDFGAYARPFHTSLIREERLIAGVYTLSELEIVDKRLHQMCLLMPKIGAGCTYEDAKTIALYEGETPGTDGFDTAVKRAMGLL